MFRLSLDGAETDVSFNFGAAPNPDCRAHTPAHYTVPGRAAEVLVHSLANQGRLTELAPMIQGRDIRLLPVHALESEGVNEIPAALAELLSEWLSLPIADSIVQSNTVGHTGASGFQRLANQALFVGEVESGRNYLLVDDFIGQGGTLANLIGYVECAGGHAVGATVLTGNRTPPSSRPTIP